MTSISVIKMIDNNLYIPTTRLREEKNTKGKGLNIGYIPLIHIINTDGIRRKRKNKHEVGAISIHRLSYTEDINT